MTIEVIMEEKAKLKVNAITRLLELIEDVNADIQTSQQIQSEAMVKQYQYMKRKYTAEILGLLSEYQLPIRLEAA